MNKKILKMLLVTLIGCVGFVANVSAEEYGTEFQKFAGDGTITITSSKFDTAAGGQGELISHYLSAWNAKNKTKFVLGICNDSYDTCTIALDDSNGNMIEQHDIQIKYEEKYSDQFKKVATDTITITSTTNGSKHNLVYAYVNKFSEEDKFSFNVDQCNEDNTMCDIILYEPYKQEDNEYYNNVEVERHAVKINYKEEYSDQFKKLTSDGTIKITNTTVQDKLYGLLYAKIGTYGTDDYSYWLEYTSEDRSSSDVILRQKNGTTSVEIERHVVKFDYKEEYSDQFKQVVKDGAITVNGTTFGDKGSLITAKLDAYRTSDYYYNLGVCNDDKSSCDIMLYETVTENGVYKQKEIERHVVKINYNEAYGEQFKKLTSDGTITVNGTTIGEVRNLVNDRLSMYDVYGDSIHYYYHVSQCNEDSTVCDVVLQKSEEVGNTYKSYEVERHALKIKTNSAVSEQFKQDIGDTITLHGSTLGDKKSLIYPYVDSLGQDKKYYYSIGQCNEDDSICDVVLRFVDEKYNTVGIERHPVKIVYGEEQFSEIFKKLTPNKQLVVKSVKPNNVEEEDLILGAYLKTLGKEDGYFYATHCSEDLSTCDIASSKTGETHTLTITYESNLDANISKIVNDMIAKFPEKKVFLLEDMELLNYFVSTNSTSVSFGSESSMINFSSEAKAYLGNMTGILDARMGVGTPFAFFSRGGFAIVYNNTVYGIVKDGGIQANHFIYIPDATEDTTEAYIKAAQQRINAYLKNENVKVTYGGKVSDLTDAVYMEEIGLDISKVVDYYNVTYNGNTSQYLVIKDSSKIKEEVEYENNDIVTGISISTTSSDVPLDTTIQVTEITKDTEQYQEIITKFNVKEAVIYDLKLFSSTTQQFISKIKDGLFQVRIPIPESMLNKDLAAYYIREDGKIEEHPITVMDGFAHFTTDHFSIYTITEKFESEDIIREQVPNTYDGIMNYVGLGIVGLIGLSITGITYKKKENK